MKICHQLRRLAPALALTVPAATTIAAESEPGVVEEVIVTATLRETNLMETPQAISAKI